jgi:serine/threonine protein kinase
MGNKSASRETVSMRAPSLAVMPAASGSPSGVLLLQEPSPEAPLPFGRYQLIRRIGAGGMGEVFLAREGASGTGHAPRACVVKKILPNLIANRSFVGRFLDEAKVVVRLSHQNIAHVYAMGDVRGEYFLAMEYVQGKTVSRFARRLRERKLEMPLGLTLLIGERVCEGLQYAHEARDENDNPLHLVHRDLSPANVCISYRGEVKIIDFGAAQSTLKEEQTAPRVVIGNLTYMAPEQAKKQTVDARADVYSCGVMLWELLAWQALPQKGDPLERWRKAANPKWEAPSRVNSAVTRDVDELVLKALRRDPLERFTNARALAEALRQARARHAPEVEDLDLGDLLARVFSKEKLSEDAVLQEVVYGKSTNDAQKEVTRTANVIPPTALAFEHTAVLAPAEMTAEEEEQLTDPGRPGHLNEGSPTPPRDRKVPRAPAPPPDGRVNAARTSFGVTFADPREPRIEPSFISEIEGIEDGLEGSVSAAVVHAQPWLGISTWKRAAILAGVFMVAVSLGFLGVWVSLQ